MSAAGAAGAASVVAAGGAAAVSGLAASCFAQAVSISAATSALRASLVFIDRYPKEKQEWYENDIYKRVWSFRESLRVAAVNSIDSTVVLKQSGELSVVYDIEPWPFVSAGYAPRTGRPRTTDLRTTRRNMASGW